MSKGVMEEMRIRGTGVGVQQAQSLVSLELGVYVWEGGKFQVVPDEEEEPLMLGQREVTNPGLIQVREDQGWSKVREIGAGNGGSSESRGPLGNLSELWWWPGTE